MRSALFLSLPLLLAAADPRVETGLDSIRQSDLRADLTFLTSDPLQGRMSLERGDDAAIQFLAAEFARAGLQPVAGDSFLQTVPLIQYRTDVRHTRLVVNHNGRSEEYRYFADFTGGGPDEMGLSAPVVFAGYGITAPEFHYDDYAGIDARGKIVLIFDHEPQEDDPASIFNGKGNTRHASTYSKMANARRHGAVGVLLASEPNRKHRSAADRMRTVPGGNERLVHLLPQALGEEAARLPMFSIGDAVTRELLSATGRAPAEIQAGIDRDLRPASTALAGVTAEMRVVLAERRRGESANVIGMLEGSDPALRGETILFSAHHDHDGAWDGRIRPGADDNGSGTVGVVELARAFARNPTRPRRTLVFAIFTAEERGLLGSHWYADHPLRPLATTRAMINFDMIGRNESPSAQTDGIIAISPDTSNELGLIGTINSPEYREVVESANREIGLRLNYKWDQDAALNIFNRSDQFPLSLADIPAVWWFTGFHPDYHQVSDTVDKINFAKMEKILRLAYLSGWQFADAERTPRFVSAPK